MTAPMSRFVYVQQNPLLMVSIAVAYTLWPFFRQWEWTALLNIKQSGSFGLRILSLFGVILLRLPLWWLEVHIMTVHACFIYWCSCYLPLWRYHFLIEWCDQVGLSTCEYISFPPKRQHTQKHIVCFFNAINEKLESRYVAAHRCTSGSSFFGKFGHRALGATTYNRFLWSASTCVSLAYENK